MERITYFNQSMEETPNTLDKYFISFFYLTLIYVFYKYCFHYFTLKNIPILSPSVPFGNIQKALRPKKPRYEYFRDLYKKIKIRGHDHGGVYLFFKPVYMPVNLGYIKNVLGEHFDYFSERGLYSKENSGENLLNLDGRRWKELRVALVPIFSSKNIKKLVVNMEKVAENLGGYLINVEGKKICIQHLSKNFTLDLVANLFFGVDLNSFTEKNTPFEKHMENIFKNSLYNSKWFIFSILFPKLYKKLSPDVYPKESLKYLENTIKDIIKFRDDNQVKKNDMLQMMLDLQNIKTDDVISHCILFSIFTNETISNVLSFSLYELSKNPEIQDKLRDEIEEVFRKNKEGNLTFEMLTEMSYLRQVVQEVLRLYPVIPTVLRQSSKDYNIPGNNEEILDKGTGVLISILGIHRDEEIYENANLFDPSRFDGEINPCGYIPYGEGPRMCPAIQFSTTIIKVGLVALLRSFKFSLGEKTKALALSKNYVLMTPKNLLYVDVEKL